MRLTPARTPITTTGKEALAFVSHVCKGKINSIRRIIILYISIGQVVLGKI